MIETQLTLKESLQEYFGFDKFKGDQEAIINSLLQGKDTFVIMPTGGGKSLCYQLPALLSEGVAIVISPLIALMKNQVDLIRNYSSKDNLAHFLNSSLNKTQIKAVKADIVNGDTKLLYVAPETLTKQENIDFFKELKISFVAVDEAHCISEWGHDFRPEYRRIRDIIEAINDSIPIIALTATATPKVQSDILKTLDLQEPNIFISSFNRSNLYYEIRQKKSDSAAVKSIIAIIKQNTGKSGIVYVTNRKTAEDVAQQLVVNGIKAAPYHAGLDNKTRTNTQDRCNCCYNCVWYGYRQARYSICYSL
jgi:ATP-dependent DNA helicase RecQ